MPRHDPGRVKTAVLISGRGSNMAALIEAAEDSDYPAEIALVISNNPEAGGLATAQSHNIEALCIDHRTFAARADFDQALHDALRAREIAFVCCAGFMRILTPEFVAKWQGRLINIHPSLLPKYKGLNTHQRAIDAGDSHHGCSVHWVTEDLDGGAVIMQDRVTVEPEDTADSLAARVLKREQKLYPRALTQAISERNA